VKSADPSALGVRARCNGVEPAAKALLGNVPLTAVLVRAGLYGDAGATLGAARVDHGATTRGFHANQKTVGLLATGNRGLIGAFHGGVLTMVIRIDPPTRKEAAS
jgi:hypothetical protein